MARLAAISFVKFDVNGANGYVEVTTQTAGGTTALTTYQDADAATAHANPVQSSGGVLPAIYLSNALYKFTVNIYDQQGGTLIATFPYDNVSDGLDSSTEISAIESRTTTLETTTAANTAAAAANATSIATNAASASTNASDITALDTRVTDVEAAQALGDSFTIRDTLTNLQAVSSPATNQGGYVYNDGSNTGFYGYNGSAWVKSSSDPVTAEIARATAAEEALDARLDPLEGDVPLMAFDGVIYESIATDSDGYFVSGVLRGDGEGLSDPMGIEVPLIGYLNEVFVRLDRDAKNLPVSGVTIDGAVYERGADGVFDRISPVQGSPLVGYLGIVWRDLTRDADGKPVRGLTLYGERYELNSAGSFERVEHDTRRLSFSPTHDAYTAITGSYTAVTQANPGVVSHTAHGLRTGQLVLFENETAMTELNDNHYRVEVINANSYYLEAITAPGTRLDTSGYGAAGTGGDITELSHNDFITDDIENTVLIVTGEGQSPIIGGNAQTSGSDAVVSTSQPYSGLVLMPDTGYEIQNNAQAAITGWTDLVEAIHNSGEAGETVFSGFSNNLARDIYRRFSKYPAAIVNLWTAKGGTPERDLGPGSLQWERNTKAVQSAVEYWQNQGFKVQVYAHLNGQGSAAGNAGPNNRPHRYDELRALKIQRIMERDAADKIATGQAKPAAHVLFYLRSAAQPQKDPWDADFEPSPHPAAFADLDAYLPHVFVFGGNYAISRGDGTNTYDSIHPTSEGYYRYGHMLHVLTWRGYCSRGGRAIKLRKRDYYWKNNKTVLCIPIEGPVDEEFTLDTSDSIVTVTTLTDTYRGFTAATDNGSGTAVQAVITGLAIGGTLAEPTLEITFSTTINSYALVMWGMRKDDSPADASGNVHDGPLHGAVTPLRGATAYESGDSGHSPTLQHTDYEWCMPDFHRFAA